MINVFRMLKIGEEKINALSLRERVIVCATLIVIVLGIMMGLITPSINEKILAKKNEITNANMIKLSNEHSLELLKQKKIIDPNRALEDLINKANQEARVLDDNLTKSKAGLVAPERMLPLLSDVFGKRSGLSLIGMVNLPPIAIDNNDNHQSGIYKHGFELKFSGSFSQVKAYLSQMENMDEKIYFDEVKYTAGQYPTGELSLRVYTLSIYEALING